MREREQQFKPGRDPEATVIRPLFDEDAAEVARPVIPLDDKAMDEGMGAYVETGTAPPAYTRAWKRRNHPTIMLLLVALFAGAVVGVTGLYFYQRSRIADAAVKTTAPEQQQQQQAPHFKAQPRRSRPGAPTSRTWSPRRGPRAGRGGAGAAERDRVRVSAAGGTTREAVRASRRAVPKLKQPRRPAAAAGHEGRRCDDEPSRTRPRVADTRAGAAGSAAERRAAREEERLRGSQEDQGRGAATWSIASGILKAVVFSSSLTCTRGENREGRRCETLSISPFFLRGHPCAPRNN